jgi:hypothetical protein
MNRFPSFFQAAACAAGLFGMLLGANRAEAQAKYAATAPGGYIAVGGTYSMYQSEYGSRVLGGAGVHVDINFSRAWGIEAEARWLRQHQLSDTHETTYLAGLRYQRHYGPFWPYAKVLAGDGEFNFPYNYGTGSYLVLAGGAGVELKVTDKLRVRLIDAEYQRWPKFTFGAITPYGVGIGITYRILNGTRPGYR